MKLRRRHILIYVLVISITCLFVVSQSYDRYSRNRTITNENRHIIEEYLSENDKRYLIDNNINVNLFLPFIKEKGFKLTNYEYYDVIGRTEKDISAADVVNKGNELVTLEFTLNYLRNTLENKVYSVDQLIYLATTPSTYFPESKPEYNPTDAFALSNQDYFITNYKPSDLVKINKSYTLNGRDIYLRKEANKQLNLMCDNLKLLTEKDCGGLKIRQGFLSYDFLKKNESTLTQLDRPGHSDFQLGNTISFNNSNTFDENGLYLWLLENMTRYGFVQRYPLDKATITNVENQPGVFRYVGVENARKIVRENQTIEELRDE